MWNILYVISGWLWMWHFEICCELFLFGYVWKLEEYNQLERQLTTALWVTATVVSRLQCLQSWPNSLCRNYRISATWHWRAALCKHVSWNSWWLNVSFVCSVLSHIGVNSYRANELEPRSTNADLWACPLLTGVFTLNLSTMPAKNNAIQCLAWPSEVLSSPMTTQVLPKASLAVALTGSTT